MTANAVFQEAIPRASPQSRCSNILPSTPHESWQVAVGVTMMSRYPWTWLPGDGAHKPSGASGDEAPLRAQRIDERQAPVVEILRPLHQQASSTDFLNPLSAAPTPSPALYQSSHSHATLFAVHRTPSPRIAAGNHRAGATACGSWGRPGQC